jgi:transcriptional regulator with XRE-family HTH domain
MKKPEFVFGERLRHLRKSKSLTQRELANIFHVSTSSIGMYEQNRRFPSFEVLVHYREFFGVTLDYILLGKE